MDRLFLNTNLPHPLSHPLLTSTETKNITSLGKYWDRWVCLGAVVYNFFSYSKGIGLVSSGPVGDVHSHVLTSIAPLDSIGRYDVHYTYTNTLYGYLLKDTCLVCMYIVSVGIEYLWCKNVMHMYTYLAITFESFRKFFQHHFHFVLFVLI